MSRYKRKAEARTETPQASPAPVKRVKLRLLQNAFVRGEFTKAGAVVSFDADEATTRLKATQLWIYA